MRKILILIPCVIEIFERMFTPNHVSHVSCHMSRSTCQVSKFVVYIYAVQCSQFYCSEVYGSIVQCSEEQVSIVVHSVVWCGMELFIRQIKGGQSKHLARKRNKLKKGILEQFNQDLGMNQHGVIYDRQKEGIQEYLTGHTHEGLQFGIKICPAYPLHYAI